MKSKKIFIGIDPGTNNIGFSFLIFTSREFFLYKSGTFCIKKVKCGKYKEIYDYFYNSFLFLKNSFKDSEIFLCVESQFVFKNPKSSFLIVSSKAIFILLSEIFLFKLIEISPTKIKKLATGFGRSSKEEIFEAMKKLFNLKNLSSFDEADAIAISFAAAFLVKI